MFQESNGQQVVKSPQQICQKKFATHLDSSGFSREESWIAVGYQGMGIKIHNC